MTPTEDLILTPPIWFIGTEPRIIAYGPFVAQKGKNRIIGMYLVQEDEETISFFDGSRQRYFQEDQITLRGLEAKDADLMFLDPDKIGVKKEDVIFNALLAFQQQSM